MNKQGAYSMDLHERIGSAIAGGQSCRSAGRHFGMSASTAIRLGAAVRKGESVAPNKIGRPAGQGKLTPFICFLIGQVDMSPDITLRELAEALKTTHGISTALSAIWNVLNRAGFTYKKNACGIRAWARRRSAETEALGN